MKATTDEGERLRNEVFRHVPHMIGKFGHDDVKDFDVTFGLNVYTFSKTITPLP